MSIKLMSLVFGLDSLGDQPLQPTEKLVMLSLSDWANDEGGSLHPSMSAIARKSCLSVSQARRIVHSFIGVGVLEVVGNARGGAPGTTPQYRLNVSRLTACADATPRTDATPTRSLTPSADARPSTGARAGMDARDGLHGCAETAGTGASQSTIEPPMNHQKVARGAGCPYAQLVKLYHDALPDNPRCHVISDSRKRHMAARWEEWRKQGKYAGVEDGLAWWGKFFVFVGQSAFLTGRAPPQPGRRTFFASVDFLFGAETHVKVIESTYHDEATA